VRIAARLLEIAALEVAILERFDSRFDDTLEGQSHPRDALLKRP